ncbi:MAG TPA: hypothetical protein VGY51_10655 [Acidimicrobiales bacterium]|nr:hypothetical protein [Acidimicrobiales bacterium]
MTDRPDDTEVNPTVRNAIPKGFSAPGGGAGAGPDAGGPEPDDSGKRHSALVGFMSVPVHPRLPIRRSTLLMVVAFVGFGTLWYLYPPASSGAASGGGRGSVCLAPGLCRGSTTVTPAPTPTTTTTSPPATTSTTTATPTTPAPSPSTTTTSSPSPTTTGTSQPGAGASGTGQTTTTTTLSGPPGASSTTTSTTR